jgi:hypothetical protein
MEVTQRVQAIKDRLKMLNYLAGKLDQTIQHENANDYLLSPVRSNLSTVERELVPWALKASTPANSSMFLFAAEFELDQAQARLNYAQEMVNKYGANLMAIGG